MAAIATLSVNPAIDVSTSVARIVPIRKLRCTPAKRDPGGGGINVARVVRRLGGDATAIYPAGGSTGQLLRRLVERERVGSVVFESIEETREDFTVVEGSTGSQFRFVLPGPELAESEWRACLDAIASIKSGIAYLVGSGSLPPGVPAGFYASAARLAKERGMKFVLDSSGAALEEALKEGVHLVKPNLHELEDLVHARLNDQRAWVEASRSLIDAGKTEIVALTLGGRGALVVTRDRVLRAEALDVTPVSAVGAGDSFLGGLVWSIASGHGLERAFRYASAAGSAAVLAPGTDLCRPADVERLYARVVIHEIRHEAFRPT